MFEPIAGESCFRASISELTTLRWDLAEEIEALSARRFEGISLWRTKLSDVGVTDARHALDRAGIRVSSLQWAGGFTGSDGRTFRESVEDAWEAIRAAAALGCGVVVVHSGCRGGHTVGHAHRLLCEALEVLAPMAWDRGVRLALQPFHPAVAAGCGFLTRVATALEWIDRFDHPAVTLALDLWQFGGESGLPGLLPDLVGRLGVVKLADRDGPPCAGGERLPPGQGELDLEPLVLSLLGHGYRGWFEFEIVGEAVEAAGYGRILGTVRDVADAWAGRSVPVPERGVARVRA